MNAQHNVHPGYGREAIAGRPWLMSTIGRKTEHTGQTTIILSGLHADFPAACDALVPVSTMLNSWASRAAEQLNRVSIWALGCDHLKRILANFGSHQHRRRLALLPAGHANRGL